jgi:hypothetical protein
MKAQAAAIGVAFLVIVAVSAGWIVHLRMGPKLDGWTAGPMILGVPVVLIGLTVIWLIARGLVGRRAQWSVAVPVVASAVFAYAVVAVMCGPIACFQQGPNRAMGWFIVGGVMAAALAHHLVRRRYTSGEG